ncbi:MAG: hypothetical protein G5Z42_01590 [Caldisphaeraceae archaeon]|nr:hypothetical protein [Caldisphaeraceae archaeon]MEB3797498.1 hypothetical protein [Caldisphaeraceae archaeon]
MEDKTTLGLSKGYTIASIVIAIFLSIIVILGGYAISTIPNSIVSQKLSNITKTDHYNISGITPGFLKAFASNVLYGYGLVYLTLALLSIPFVYLPLSHDLPEKAQNPALVIGIIEVVVGIVTIVYLIPGILMLIQWHNIKRYNYTRAIINATRK